MLNDLEALEVFASLCTTGSIQKTAQALGIDSPTASRKLTKLETQLGRQLINREKRPFEMTADACAIIGSVKKILEERQQIETYYRRLQSDDSMLIRVMHRQCSHQLRDEVHFGICRTVSKTAL